MLEKDANYSDQLERRGLGYPRILTHRLLLSLSFVPSTVDPTIVSDPDSKRLFARAAGSHAGGATPLAERDVTLYWNRLGSPPWPYRS